MRWPPRDNDRVRDVPIERGTGLGSLRRYTWWSLVGTFTFFVVFVAGRWVLDPRVAIWARVLGAVALSVMVVAGVVLLSRRLPRVPAGAARQAPRRVAGRRERGRGRARRDTAVLA
jgi:hypothetical protein